MSYRSADIVKLDTDHEKYRGHNIRAVRPAGQFKYACEVDGVLLAGDRYPVRLWTERKAALLGGRKHVRRLEKAENNRAADRADGASL